MIKHACFSLLYNYAKFTHHFFDIYLRKKNSLRILRNDTRTVCVFFWLFVSLFIVKKIYYKIEYKLRVLKYYVNYEFVPKTDSVKKKLLIALHI